MDKTTLANELRQIDEAMSSNFAVIEDMFSNPLSATMQGCMFPKGHKQLLWELRTRCVKDSVNKVTALDPSYGKSLSDLFAINIVAPIQKLEDYLGSQDLGQSGGLKCMHDYRDKIREIDYNGKIRPKIHAWIKEIENANA